MARAAGTPERTLRREFTAAVGLPPKVVARIARVRRAQAAIARGQALSAIAVHCGFADQAHMTREFMELIGKTPSSCDRGRLGRYPTRSSLWVADGAPYSERTSGGQVP
jgi:AraC-like DNA-binding protein